MSHDTMTATIPFTQRIEIDTPDGPVEFSLAFPSPEQVAANEALLVAGDVDFALQYRLRCCIVGPESIEEMVRRWPGIVEKLAELVDAEFAGAEFQ